MHKPSGKRRISWLNNEEAEPYQWSKEDEDLFPIELPTGENSIRDTNRIADTFYSFGIEVEVFKRKNKFYLRLLGKRTGEY
ncbi:MAG: hypothetical protein ACI92I_000970 [Acidimicrobiales bacterium]|jgi:hypothetical protein